MNEPVSSINLELFPIFLGFQVKFSRKNLHKSYFSEANIRELSLEPRIKSLLRKLRISTIGSLLLTSKDNLKKKPWFGKKRIKQIQNALWEYLLNEEKPHDSIAYEIFNPESYRKEPISKKLLESLPLFTSEGIKLAPAELHETYQPDLSVIDLSFPNRVKRIFRKMRITSVGKLLLTPGEKITKQPWCGKGILRDIQNKIVNKLLDDEHHSDSPKSSAEVDSTNTKISKPVVSSSIKRISIICQNECVSEAALEELPIFSSKRKSIAIKRLHESYRSNSSVVELPIGDGIKYKLRKIRIFKIGTLLMTSTRDLLRKPGFGKASVKQIQEALIQYLLGKKPVGKTPFQPEVSKDRWSKFIPALDPAVVEQVTDVLSSHFTNGYRLNSLIEMARFRSFATEDLDEEITLTDEELKSYIVACGTSFDGKAYAVSAQAKEQIKKQAEEYFADGAQAIFFAEFYAKNENWLFEASVVSEDMLIDILRKLFPKLSFTQTYFGYTNASIFTALEGEILRVWGDDILLTYSQLAERLRYVPLERIKSALSQNGDFIWSSEETYSHVSRIEITDEQRQVIREAAVRECNACGFTSITNLPIGEMEERNYELSITAVHNAVYHICLSDKFDKKGKIVTRKGDVIDALTIMKEYCRTIDKCSLDDLLTYAKELTGEVHRWISMEAGNTVLIRIDIDTYVADRYVYFNIDIIDEAIELLVKGDYLPLKSFTTFGAFPDCGQTWNLFLLESYCRRFSRKFRFDALTVNSRNAGAVIRISCSMDYTEIMTDAVAKADVPLKGTAVGKFMFETGYTGRSTTARVNEIIDKAKAIRERRV